ncbi:hypothetical protein N2599_07720 [Rhizobium sullae]|uniref:Glycosyl transferase family 1 n=1 Tax=Rhizobium sullae TaxID=50338 RepID=A0ABY5XMQ4_RHISU|nr:hypothetical protein [Rhizobium sullae]UWU15873.1 hypothetical protein N2599_07720 [Rhizobium sullae]
MRGGATKVAIQCLQTRRSAGIDCTCIETYLKPGPFRHFTTLRTPTEPLTRRSTEFWRRERIVFLGRTTWEKSLGTLGRGIPVIVSSNALIAEEIEGNGAGLVFKSGDAGSLAEALVKIKSNSLVKWLAEGARAFGKKVAPNRQDWERRFTGIYTGEAARPCDGLGGSWCVHL